MNAQNTPPQNSPAPTSPLTPPASLASTVPTFLASPARKFRVILAGGGTGGHLYPGLSIAQALQAQLGDSLELIWAATPRPVDQRLLSSFGPRYIRQPVQPLQKNIKKLWAFWKGWFQSCRYWKAAFATTPVDAVVALGGYAAGPAAYIASKRGIPVILLNPDALPGLANRFLLRRSNLVITQWPLSPDYHEVVRGRTLALGCPIRTDLLNRTRPQAAAQLNLDPSLKTLVITGASLGAKTINDALLALLHNAEFRKVFEPAPADAPTALHATIPAPEIDHPHLEIGTPPQQWQILHLAGLDQAAEVRAAYAKFPLLRATILDYCDDMASVWAIADLAIARAGASTCAELTACGIPSILLPYPYHKDLHQRANALELARAGAAIIVDDEKNAAANAPAVKNALLPLLYDSVVRERMADAARAAGKPDAAQNIATEILALIAPKMR